MIEKIDVGMAPSNAPVSDCVKAGQQVWLVAIAEDPATGEIVQGDIGVQTRRTLENLKRAITAAGGTMADITQVQIFLTDKADAAGMNAVYREYFTEPYPVRATVIAGLLAEGLKVEMLATGVIG
ncbi:RidA family protein [Devosia naphthalenivorans]|jgi:enamine deaminase RidA (YjgF/YER057c/UK114 family)|uniref:RidA family protein n=1 Tax=Devosia naphthalenivorans TaxID=2082392 RepID=UPI000D359957|nr:RidA family protein [Devosia naphthalenivorans]